MNDFWVALIELPTEAQQAVATVLAPVGARVKTAGWEESPKFPPALIVAPFDRYCQNIERSTWVTQTVSHESVILLSPVVATTEMLQWQRESGVLNVLPEGLLTDPACLGRILHAYLFPEGSFDTTLFLPDPDLHRTFPIRTLAEKHQIAEEVADLIRPYTADPRSLRDAYLIINELINNAFFHSFITPSGEEKYSPRHFSRLEEQDRVMLEVAARGDTVAISVEDNRGSLSPAEVLKYMLRQTSGEGIYDSHGRGFYLVSSLVDHLLICVERGLRTRIMTLRHTGARHPLQSMSFFVTS